MKKILSIILATTMVIGFGSCKKEDKTDNSTTSNTTSKEIISDVGNKITIDDFEIQYISSRIKNEIVQNDIQLYKPSNENNLFVVEISTINKGDEKATAFDKSGKISAKLECDGMNFEPTHIDDLKSDLQNLEMQPQDSEIGLMVFEIPKDLDIDKSPFYLLIENENDEVYKTQLTIPSETKA